MPSFLLSFWLCFKTCFGLETGSSFLMQVSYFLLYPLQMISYLQSFPGFREEVLIIYIRTEINCMSFWVRKSSPSSLPSSNSPTVSETLRMKPRWFSFGRHLQSSLYLLFFFKHQKCILSHCGGQESKFKGWAGWFFQTLQGESIQASVLALGAPGVPCCVDTAPPSLPVVSWLLCLLAFCVPFIRSTVQMQDHPDNPGWSFLRPFICLNLQRSYF